MKCRHNVTSNTWTTCPHCGKQVRRSFLLFGLKWLLLFAYAWFGGAGFVASSMLGMFGLAENAQGSPAYILIAGVSIFAVWKLIEFLIPECVEKRK